MKRIILTGLVLIISLNLLFAQAKVYETVDKIEKAQEGVEKAKKFGNTLKGLIPKKKETTPDKAAVAKNDVPAVTSAPTTPPASTGLKTTVLTLSGVDFAKLKTLNENVRACAGVESAALSFKGAEPSTITVNHSGTTESLMKLVQLTSKDIFTEKNYALFEEGKITIKL